MLLLKRIRRDIRKGDLKAFESRLNDLKEALAWLRPKMVQVQCRFGCREVVSVPEYVFEHFPLLKHKCGSLTSLKYRVQSSDPKPYVATDQRGDAENPKETKSEPVQETLSQQIQPAKQLSLMLSWNCPRCRQVIKVPRWYMENHPVYTGMTHDCGKPIEWPSGWSDR